MVYYARQTNDCLLCCAAGFVDPFDVRRDVTLDNPAYRFWGFSLMAGKLDWMLLRRLSVQHMDIGNHDYAASDHKWLSVDATFDT